MTTPANACECVRVINRQSEDLFRLMDSVELQMRRGSAAVRALCGPGRPQSEQDFAAATAWRDAKIEAAKNQLASLTAAADQVEARAKETGAL